MELTLIRKHLTEISTIGELFLNGERLCYILEDKDRFLKSTDDLEHIKTQKVYGKTAIPTGRYEIIVSFSNRFQKPLPLLLNVPGFEGIRIHSGNVDTDTDGCLLPGIDYETDKVNNSRAAFLPLARKIDLAVMDEKVFITIQHEA